MSSVLASELVIQTSQLDALIDRTSVLLVFVGSEEAYRKAHIPGSHLIRPAELVCGVAPAVGKLPDADDLALLFSRIGLRDNHTVIAYDDEGGGWAGRLIWTLDIIGHSHYHYLDGGLVAWLSEQRQTDSGINDNFEPSSYTIDINQSLRVTVEDIMKSLDDNNFIVWDARSEQEYRGEKVLAARGGHIPGASNIDWLELIDRGNHLRLKPLETLKTMLDDKKLTPEKTIITHCQTHHRSGLSYLVGKIMGLNIKAYDGSWSEWGNLIDTPIEL